MLKNNFLSVLYGLNILNTDFVNLQNESAWQIKISYTQKIILFWNTFFCIAEERKDIIKEVN